MKFKNKQKSFMVIEVRLVSYFEEGDDWGGVEMRSPLGIY